MGKFGPYLVEEVAEKSGRDIEWRNKTGGQVEVHHDESELYAQNDAHHKRLSPSIASTMKAPFALQNYSPLVRILQPSIRIGI